MGVFILCFVAKEGPNSKKKKALKIGLMNEARLEGTRRQVRIEKQGNFRTCIAIDVSSSGVTSNPICILSS